MPLEGIFLEPSSTKPVPDLSLHISPPNCDSSSRTSNARSEAKKSSCSNSFTELSLAHPANEEIELSKSFFRSTHHHHHHQEEQLQPQNPYHHIYQQSTHGNGNNNNSLSQVDASSDGLRPIKGIPVYPNRPFPFLANLDKDPRMRFCQMSYPSNFSPSSTCSSSSSSSVSNSPYFVGGLDHHMPLLNLGSNASSPSSSAYRGGRFNGLASGYQLHHLNQYGVGPTHEAAAPSHHHHHGMMRSRFLPKLPAKRSMRAPRMRWTSTLHSRFVHAVELLGGHESILF